MFAAVGAGWLWVTTPVDDAPVAWGPPVGAGRVGAGDVVVVGIAVDVGSAGKVVPVAVVGWWLGSGSNCETVEPVPYDGLYMEVSPARRLLEKPDVVDNVGKCCGAPPVRRFCVVGIIDNPVPPRRLSSVGVVASALSDAVVSPVLVYQVRLLLLLFDIVACSTSFNS